MAVSSESRLSVAAAKAQTRLLELIASQHSFDTLLQFVVKFVEQFAPQARCCISIADDKAKVLRFAAAPHLSSAFVRAIDGSPIREGEGSCGTAAFRRELVAVSDISTSPLWESRRQDASAAGLAACWSTPLFDSRELIGSLAMYYAQPRVPTAPELEFIRLAGSLAEIVAKRFRVAKQPLHSGVLSYHQLAEKSPDPIIAHVNGRLVFVNQAGCALLHIDAFDSGREIRLEQFVPEHLRHQWLTHRTGPLSSQLRVGAGQMIRVEATATAMTMAQEYVTVLSVRDVTRRVAMESALFEAETRLQEHLAFDLHDCVGQQLTGVSLLLHALKTAATPSLPRLTEDFSVLSELVSKCIGDIRILAGSMAPVTLQRVGLAGALKVLQQKAENIYGLTAGLSIAPAAGWTLDSEDANQLFRVVQEAIVNVARHANATKVEIDGHDDRGVLVITIADDGIGIADAAFNASGLGLRSMRYRAEQIGGELAIMPRTPTGTAVQIRYPMRN